MALSYNEVVAGTGQTLVTVTFPFLDRSHVKVSVDREDLPGSAWTWVSDASIQLNEPMVGGEALRAYRETPSAGVQADFQPGAFDYQELNTSLSHLLYIVQEAYDNAISAVEAGHSAFAYLVQIEELADEIALIFADTQAIQTAITGHSAEAIATINALVASASALHSETLTYRDAALGYRNQAQLDAGVATNKASEAASSASEAASTKSEVDSLKIAVEGLEGAAATSAITATNAMSAVQTLYDNFMSAYENFNDRYLGPHGVPPTTDNDGEPLIGGALYFDTSGPTGVMKVWDGVEWRAAYVSFEGTPLTAQNNLGDLTNVPQARINLGLGSVDNTPDLSKPVSNPTQTALNAKLDKSDVWKGNLAAYNALTKDPNVLYFVTP